MIFLYDRILCLYVNIKRKYILPYFTFRDCRIISGRTSTRSTIRTGVKSVSIVRTVVKHRLFLRPTANKHSQGTFVHDAWNDWENHRSPSPEAQSEVMLILRFNHDPIPVRESFSSSNLARTHFILLPW